MKGLLIDFNPRTGERAGGIKPKTPEWRNLRGSPGWQNMDAGQEVRIVLDGDVEKYRNVEGITVLEDEAAIDAAVAQISDAEDDYAISHEALMVESIRQKQIDITDLDMSDEKALAKALYERGALGVKKREKECPKACDLVAASAPTVMRKG